MYLAKISVFGILLIIIQRFYKYVIWISIASISFYFKRFHNLVGTRSIKTDVRTDKQKQSLKHESYAFI